MTARLTRPGGTAARPWPTTDLRAALTDDRNCPPEWRVKIDKED